MVLPVIAAGAAEAAGAAAARGAAGAAAKKGVQTAGRSAGSAAKKGLQTEGRNITRTRRNSSLDDSFNRRAKPSTATRQGGTVRGRIDAQTKQFVPYDQDEGEEFPQGSTTKKEKQGPKIGLVASFFLLYLALVTEVLEFALDAAGTSAAGVGVLIGILIDLIRWVLLPVIFIFLGAPFWKGRKAKKKMTAMLSGLIIELVPWLGGVAPATLISVASTIYITNKEAKGQSANASAESLERNIVRAKRMAQKR